MEMKLLKEKKMKVINNFIDNSKLEDLIKKLPNEELNYKFKNYQFFEDDVLGKIMTHKLVCSNLEDVIDLEFLEKQTGKIKKIFVNLITKSTRLVTFQPEQSDYNLIVLFGNNNDGFLKVDNYKKIECSENTMVAIPAKTPFTQSSCTDKDYKIYFEIYLQE